MHGGCGSVLVHGMLLWKKRGEPRKRTRRRGRAWVDTCGELLVRRHATKMVLDLALVVGPYQGHRGGDSRDVGPTEGRGAVLSSILLV